MLMSIENPDSLRNWLTETLAPICDADPAALAKYVMALLKKDKPEQELKDFCIDQLDVFLQRETKPFVDKLFTAIQNRSYLVSPSKSASSSAPVVSDVAPTSAPSVSSAGKSQAISSKSPRDTSPVRGGNQAVTSSSGGRTGASSGRSTKKGSTSPAHRSTEYRSSRSRSRDRVSGYKAGGSDRKYDHRQSKDQRRDTDKENRTSRSRKSPVPTSSQPSSSTGASSKGSTTRKGDRGDSDGSGDDEKQEKKRKKLRCRDFDEKGFCMRGDLCPYDHGPDPVVVDDIALPAMISITSSGSTSKPPPTGAPNFTVPPPGYRTAPPAVHPPPPGLDSGPYQQQEAYNPEAPAISVAVPPPGYNRPPPPTAVGAVAVPRHPPPIWTQQPPPLFLPQPGGTVRPAPLPVPLPVPIPTQISVHRAPVPSGREVIALAEPSDGGNVRTVIAAPVPRISMTPFRPSGGKRPFGAGSIAGSQTGPRTTIPYDKNNCTLEVRRIPSQLNTITKLNEHFQQFGQIVNMQLRYENDPEAALITFATRQQAVAAYKSTAPILNNRFIKIFWHDKESSGEASGQPSGKPSIKDRLGMPVNVSNAGPSSQPSSDTEDINMKQRGSAQNIDDDGTHRAVLVTASGGLTRTIYNPEAIAAAASQKTAEKVASATDPTTPPSPAVQKPQFPIMQPSQRVHPKLLKKQQKLQEAMKKSLELQKAKADLLKKQVEQQKLLLAQLEKCTNPAQKKEIIKTIKSLEKTIKAATEDLAKAAKPSSRATSKESLEKEMLDTELEFIRQKQAGEDTSDLQRRLTELRLELAAFLARSLPMASDPKMLATSTPIQGIHPGGPHPKRRRVAPETAVLDKRPRDLSVSGFQADEKDALIEHLQHYGMLEDIEFQHSKSDQMCRATVTYKTRREAETALANGNQFRNHQLTIQWAHQRTVSVSEPAGSSGNAPTAGTDQAPAVEMTAEEILASLDDDEEDEEEEESENEDSGEGEDTDM